MNELKKQEANSQTPIEVALGIDEEGKTTAKQLYEFLELNPAHYSRWAKTNILENTFAEEATDYEVLTADGENPQGGRPTQDYKLTAQFAKKLSMMAKSEKGNQARDYFIRVEQGAKEMVSRITGLSPELQMFLQMGEAMARQELAQKQQAERLEIVDQKLDSIKEVVALAPTAWRKDSGKLINKMAEVAGGYEHIGAIRSDIYRLLDERYGVSLNTRLTNKRRRMAEEGVCKSKRDKLNQLDIIADDKKLIEGYVSIVKEMSISYGVDAR